MRFHCGLLTAISALAALIGCRGTHKDLPKSSGPGYQVVLQWGAEGNGPGEFNGIQGLAVDGKDRIYAADAENCRVQVFDQTGQFLRTFGQCGDGAGRIPQTYGRGGR